MTLMTCPIDIGLTTDKQILLSNNRRLLTFIKKNLLRKVCDVKYYHIPSELP